MPLYSHDDTGKLVPVSDLPEEALQAIERAETETIVQRLTDANAQPWYAYAYTIHTKDGDRDIVGISVDGAREIARQLGNIRVSSDIKIEDRGDYYYAIVPVTDIVRNVTLLGVARQSKYRITAGFEQSDKVDEWAFVSAINKAQRNGILAVAPQEAVQKIIQILDPRLIKRLQPLPQSDPKKVTTESTENNSDTPTQDDRDKLKKLCQELGYKAQDAQVILHQLTGKRSGWTKGDFKVAIQHLENIQASKML